ncbi:hypothetical protein BD410DRAFT_868470 [Rickenella mellea]|uniref:Ricin B lectin domain-containing protein n=1 Tax=Rickenella mellea TaxID=50990 RepID=A0A4Y7Q0B9_9AGAM|nr:hypothetical protein BD410DRAFT_868470 [Rickenella mellea]
MPINPGAYTIRNVTHQNVATQSEENMLVGLAHSNTASTWPEQGLDLFQLWSISLLQNGKYTIRNIETNRYAACTNFPMIDETIIATQELQQWDIKESGFKGRYVIYTTSGSIELFWGLPNGHRHTLICLRDRPNNPANQWEIRTVDSWKVVGQLRANITHLRNVHAELSDEYEQLYDNHTSLLAEHTSLRDSTELLTRQDRARHAQAEAMLKEEYEKLLAEKVSEYEYWRCVCM